MYISGHSLFTHNDSNPPNGPADDYTRTGTWMGLIAQEAGWGFSGGGNFGQIAALNADWDSNWSASPGPPASGDIQYDYSSNTTTFYPSGTFAGQDFTHFLFMASNFEQVSDTPASWVARTQTILDRMNGQEPNAECIFYLHWPLPDLAGNFVDDTDLTAGEFTTYKAYARGDYMDWHTEWFDLVKASRPSITMRMIPVGPVIFDLLDNESYMSTVTYADLFSDASPHGQQSVYFLAGIVMSIALHKALPDLSSFSVPVGATQVISEISSNLPAIAAYVQARLAYYSDQGMKVY